MRVRGGASNERRPQGDDGGAIVRSTNGKDVFNDVQMIAFSAETCSS